MWGSINVHLSIIKSLDKAYLPTPNGCSYMGPINQIPDLKRIPYFGQNRYFVALLQTYIQISISTV